MDARRPKIHDVASEVSTNWYRSDRVTFTVNQNEAFLGNDELPRLFKHRSTSGERSLSRSWADQIKKQSSEVISINELTLTLVLGQLRNTPFFFLFVRVDKIFNQGAACKKREQTRNKVHRVEGNERKFLKIIRIFDTPIARMSKMFIKLLFPLRLRSLNVSRRLLTKIDPLVGGR